MEQNPNMEQQNQPQMEDNSQKNKQMLTVGAGIAILVAVFAAIMVATSPNGDNTNDTPNPTDDNEVVRDNDLDEDDTMDPSDSMLIEDEEPMAGATFEPMAMASLVDVTPEGGNASGTAYYTVENGQYMLYAEFMNLPPLEDGYFYEGWVVRQDPFEFISTGEIYELAGVQVNEFESNTDYSDFGTYILTLEPDDGDPAPADHIVEGAFEMLDLERDNAPVQESPPAAMESPPANSGPGAYAEYNESLLANANSGDVVLFFKADWCPSCNVLDADITANLSDIPNDVTILDVDYDDNTDLREKYNVRTQHTMVQVDAEGNEIKTWIGSFSLDDILSEIV